MCLAVSGGVAYAAPAPTPSGGGGGQALAPAAVCTIKDPRLRELSGLVATKNGYIVINDGTEIANRKQIFFLDGKCKVTKAVQYSGSGPFDTEDLALSADGKMLWIADTGDNITSTERRSKVALWSMPADGSKKPILHRLAYPGGEPRDAEALLMADDGTPTIITKTTGKAEIFTPAAALKTNNTDPVPMKKVGEVTLPKSSTDNPLKVAGRVAITGAARSPDGSRVVLRTYADAFEWDVSGGDIVQALTSGKPRMTPLADPFGEALSYTPDGATFVTVSDAGTLGDKAEVSILSYQPSTKSASDVKAEAPKAPGDTKSWSDSLTLQDITYLIAAVGILGAVLVVAGVMGILRSRRRRSHDDADGTGGPGGGNGPKIGRQTQPGGPGDPSLAAVGGRRGGYGAGYSDDYQMSGPARRPSGGAVYGGQPASGSGQGGRSAGPAPGRGTYGGGNPSGQGRRGQGYAGNRGMAQGRDDRDDGSSQAWGAPGGGYRDSDYR